MCYFFCVITFFLWGSIYVVSKYAFASFTTLTVLFLRDAIALIPLFIAAKKAGLKKIQKEHYRFFIITGICGYTLGSGMVLYSNNLMGATVASLINAASPIAIIAMAALILKETLTANKIIGLTCALSGVIIVVGTGSGVTAIGLIMAVAGMVFWAWGSITIRRISSFYSPAQIGLVCMLISLPPSLLGAAVETLTTPAPEPVTWLSVGAIVYLGILGIGIPNLLWNICLARMEASTCSMFYPLQPLFSGILGVIFLSEQFTESLIFGGIVISAGVILGLINFKKKKPNQE